MGKINETKDLVMEYLIKKYIEKDHDFYFKARKIDINRSPKSIGIALVHLERENKITLWNSKRSKRSKIYKTNFEN